MICDRAFGPIFSELDDLGRDGARAERRAAFSPAADRESGEPARLLLVLAQVGQSLPSSRNPPMMLPKVFRGDGHAAIHHVDELV